VELYKFHPALVLFSHDRIGQSFCGKGFSHARGSLKDDVLFSQKHGHKTVVFRLRHIYLFQEIFFCIRLCPLPGKCRRIVLTNHIHNKIKFSFGKLKQASLLIDKVLHSRKLRAGLQSQIINRRRKSLNFFKIDLLSILLCGYFANRHHLFHWIGFVTDDEIPSFGVQEILKNAALIAVLVVKGVGLHLSHSKIRKTPDVWIGIQPPIMRLVLFLGNNIQ